MIDRTTKALLALIAIGLFLNVFVPLLQPPVRSTSGSEVGRPHETNLNRISIRTLRS